MNHIKHRQELLDFCYKNKSIEAYYSKEFNEIASRYRRALPHKDDYRKENRAAMAAAIIVGTILILIQIF